MTILNELRTLYMYMYMYMTLVLLLYMCCMDFVYVVGVQFSVCGWRALMNMTASDSEHHTHAHAHKIMY